MDVCQLSLSGKQNVVQDRLPDATHRGSMMSNNKGSVTRSQTSYAFVFLNSDIQSMLKSCIAFGFPARRLSASHQTKKTAREKDSPDPSAMTTPFPCPLARKVEYLTQANAPEMYSSN